MKSRHTVTLAVLAGVGFGAIAVHGLHAQAKPPAYVVVDIADITDPETFKTLFPFAERSMKEFNGRYVIRTEKITGFDGTAPKRFIVLAFDSVEKAQAWHNSADTKQVDAIRAKAAKSSSFLVEGM